VIFSKKRLNFKKFGPWCRNAGLLYEKKNFDAAGLVLEFSLFFFLSFGVIRCVGG
jgi:hypothetical protein